MGIIKICVYLIVAFKVYDFFMSKVLSYERTV